MILGGKKKLLVVIPLSTWSITLLSLGTLFSTLFQRSSWANFLWEKHHLEHTLVTIGFLFFACIETRWFSIQNNLIRWRCLLWGGSLLPEVKVKPDWGESGCLVDIQGIGKEKEKPSEVLVGNFLTKKGLKKVRAFFSKPFQNQPGLGKIPAYVSFRT